MAITDTSKRSATNGGAPQSATRGRAVLRDAQLNHGTAFTPEERAALGLTGLLPAGVLSLEEQARRSYEQYGAQPTNLAKNAEPAPQATARPRVGARSARVQRAPLA